MALVVISALFLENYLELLCPRINWVILFIIHSYDFLHVQILDPYRITMCRHLPHAEFARFFLGMGPLSSH